MKKERSAIIIKSGVWFILTNFTLALINAIIGILAGSIAILSDATHSLIDAISGFFVIISEKLATHDKFNSYREKIERITTIIIALIIIITGLHIFIESIEKMLQPEEPDYTAATIIILIVSIALKLALALYLRKRGKEYHSTVLSASGTETMNDTWISIAVLISAIFYMLWHIDIEAYVSLIISVLIMKIGLEFIFPHISHHHHHALETNPNHDHCKKSKNR